MMNEDEIPSGPAELIIPASDGQPEQRIQMSEDDMTIGFSDLWRDTFLASHSVSSDVLSRKNLITKNSMVGDKHFGFTAELENGEVGQFISDESVGYLDEIKVARSKADWESLMRKFGAYIFPAQIGRSVEASTRRWRRVKHLAYQVESEPREFTFRQVLEGEYW